MPVRKMPSNVPAPPMEAMGVPSSAIFLRLSKSAPMKVPAGDVGKLRCMRPR